MMSYCDHLYQLGLHPINHAKGKPRQDVSTGTYAVPGPPVRRLANPLNGQI